MLRRFSDTKFVAQVAIYLRAEIFFQKKFNHPEKTDELPAGVTKFQHPAKVPQRELIVTVVLLLFPEAWLITNAPIRPERNFYWI
jgi:hypothetical protein